jgi:hypothetical protein
LFLHVASQIQCNALACLARFGGGVLYMQAAYAYRGVSSAQPQPVAHGHLAVQCGAGHHQPGTAQAEGTVDGQAKALSRWRGAAAGVQQMLAQLLCLQPLWLET